MRTPTEVRANAVGEEESELGSVDPRAVTRQLDPNIRIRTRAGDEDIELTKGGH